MGLKEINSGLKAIWLALDTFVAARKNGGHQGFETYLGNMAHADFVILGVYSRTRGGELLSVTLTCSVFRILFVLSPTAVIP